MVLAHPNKAIESHRQRCSTIDIWESGIIHIKIDDSCEIELSDSQAQYEFINQIQARPNF